MKIKDIVKVALFGAVGFIISMMGGMLVSLMGTLGPFVHSSLGSLLQAPIFYVMCHKVHKKGAIFLFYMISGIVYLLMGMWPMTVICLGSAIVGELIVGGDKGYTENTRLLPSYVLSQLVMALHGLILLLWFGPEGMAKQFPSMFTVEVAKQKMDFLLAPKNLVIIIAIQLIFSLLGAFFGKYMNNKFFSKNSKEKSILD